MARCPDCNKFVSYDEPQAEAVSDPEVSSSQCIEGSVRVVLNCGECGTELKDAEIEFSITIDHECNPDDILDKWLKAGRITEANMAEYQKEAESLAASDYEDEQFSVEDSSFDGDSRTQTTMRVLRGRGENRKWVEVPIKNYRYQRMFYGFSGTVTLACNRCGQTFDMDVSGEEQASSFNELT